MTTVKRSKRESLGFNPFGDLFHQGVSVKQEKACGTVRGQMPGDGLRITCS